MSDCCLTADPVFLGPMPFRLKCGDDAGSAEVVSNQPRESSCFSEMQLSSSTASTSLCAAVRSSLKRPKAIGLQRFNFSLVHDDFSDCPMSHKPLHQQHHHQQSWECNQSTSDKTWERTSSRQSRSSFSVSLPCLPVSSTSGQPTNILPFLYLGSQHDALSEDVIKRNGITHILNVSTTSPRSPFVPEMNFLRIPVNDSHTDRLLPHFQEAFQFLDEVRISNGCALVHCLAGISRSPTMVIAYIMRSLSMTTDEAYSFVKEKRASISPNFNFLGQLVEFESLCRQKRNGELVARQSTDSSEDIKDSICLESAQRKPTSCPWLPKIVEMEPCLLNSTLNDFHSDIRSAFDREERKTTFPCNWESQFSQVSTKSLDQLCFTPCFARVPNEDAKESSVVRPSDCCDCHDQSAVNSQQVENLEAKSKSGRTRRHTARPRSSTISAVQFGFSSIKSSLKSSLKSSIFKRTEHHNKPVLLMD